MLRIKRTSATNRNTFGIVAEILRQLRMPTGKTNIMSHCNMSTAQSGQYLTLMKSSDLIRIDTVAGRVTYERTNTGREFLELYNKMIVLLDPEIPAAPAM
jgi:predicted transcriptional regulator